MEVFTTTLRSKNGATLKISSVALGIEITLIPNREGEPRIDGHILNRNEAQNVFAALRELQLEPTKSEFTFDDSAVTLQIQRVWLKWTIGQENFSMSTEIAQRFYAELKRRYGFVDEE